MESHTLYGGNQKGSNKERKGITKKPSEKSELCTTKEKNTQAKNHILQYTSSKKKKRQTNY